MINSRHRRRRPIQRHATPVSAFISAATDRARRLMDHRHRSAPATVPPFRSGASRPLRLFSQRHLFVSRQTDLIARVANFQSSPNLTQSYST